MGGETENRLNPAKRVRISAASRAHQIALRPKFGNIGVMRRVYESSGLGCVLNQASQMNERQKGVGELVVAGGNASELLDTVEEAFDQIAALVDMPVERTGGEAMGSRRDDRLTALFRYRRHEGIRVVALVGHDKPGALILDQGTRLIDVGYLACREEMRSGLPKASTATCNLVVSPPRERPIS